MRSYGLSKSRIMSGLQCAKRLYLEVHHPELAEKSADKEALFAVGRQVGELAQTLYPGGTLIDHADDLKGALQETETLLSASGDALLFEAALQHDGVLFRADILAKESNSIRLIEVKSSTKAKDEHYQDCAIQAWVLRNAGYPVDGVELAHLDNTFVYDGNGDYTGLFTHVDLTGEVRALELDVPDWVARSKEILAASVPEVEVGSHCKKPYDCPFMSHCLSEGPEYPLIHMPRGGKLVEDVRLRTMGSLGRDCSQQSYCIPSIRGGQMF